MSIDEILKKYFGCNKLFLKQRRVVGYWFSDKNEPDYEYTTRAGGKAYRKLVSMLRDLEKLLGGDVIDANYIIRELDGIISDKYY